MTPNLHNYELRSLLLLEIGALYKWKQLRLQAPVHMFTELPNYQSTGHFIKTNDIFIPVGFALDDSSNLCTKILLDGRVFYTYIYRSHKTSLTKLSGEYEDYRYVEIPAKFLQLIYGNH